MQTSPTTWFVSNIGTPEPTRPSPPPTPPPAPPAQPPTFFASTAEWETPIMALPWRGMRTAATSSVKPYFILAGTTMLLIGLSLLVYSALTAAALGIHSVPYWVSGLSLSDLRRLTPVGSWGWDNVLTSLVEIPGRITAWWGGVLLVVGGSTTAFSLSFRPRLRAGR